MRTMLAAGLVALAAWGKEGARWDPVPRDLLELKEPRLQKDAEAEVVHNQIVLTKLDEEGTIHLTRSVRIKLFTAAGVQNWSVVSLTSEPGLEYRDVTARTVTPDGVIYVLEQADMAERELTKGFRRGRKVLSFTVPKAQPGAVIEYRYQVRHKEAWLLPLVVQDDIPTWHFSLTIPSKAPVRWYSNLDKMDKPTEEGGCLRLVRAGIEAFREEAMMPPEPRSRGMVLVRRISEFGEVGWDEIATVRYVEFDKATEPNKQVKAVAREVTANLTDDKEKLKALDRYCRTQIRNLKAANASAGVEALKNWKTARSAGETLERKAGGGREINLLFASLARGAGFQVYPVSLEDREGPQADQRDPLLVDVMFPARSIAVRHAQGWMIHDPATPHMAPGTLRWQEQGVMAAVFGPNQTWFGSTPSAAAALTKTTRTGELAVDAAGTLRGTIELAVTGHAGTALRTALAPASPEKQKEIVLEALKTACPAGNWTLEKIENFDNAELPLRAHAAVECPGYAGVTGKRMLLTPAIFQHNRPALLTEATRVHPIWIPWGRIEEDTISIRYPAEFGMEDRIIPAKNVSFRPVGRYDAAVEHESETRTLRYRRRFEFGTQGGGEVDVAHYGPLKAILDAVHTEDGIVVSLTRKAGDLAKGATRP